MRFSGNNEFGVADHWVFLPDGTTVYVPLRAVANGDGTEVTLTLYRQPSMDDAKFQDGRQLGHAGSRQAQVGPRGAARVRPAAGSGGSPA